MPLRSIPEMYLAYFDESGDSGIAGSPTTHFVLACVLVHESRWMESLDHLVMFRRVLKRKFGVPTRGELKATHIRRGKGPLLHLKWSPAQRMDLYRKLFVAVCRKLDHVRIFAIAIEKAGAQQRFKEARETAWEYAIQRLNKFSGDNEYTMIFPDEGHGFFIRKMMRRMRRYHRVPRHWGTGTIEFPTTRLIEDPNDRRSHDSFFIQLADWAAYAAHRSSYCSPSPSVPPDLWDELDNVLLKRVNRIRGGPPGIVLYP